MKQLARSSYLAVLVFLFAPAVCVSQSWQGTARMFDLQIQGVPGGTGSAPLDFLVYAGNMSSPLHLSCEHLSAGYICSQGIRNGLVNAADPNARLILSFSVYDLDFACYALLADRPRPLQCESRPQDAGNAQDVEFDDLQAVGSNLDFSALADNGP